jgi:ubiquinone/menaquinone biosynthesis C-methylase UbiE
VARNEAFTRVFHHYDIMNDLMSTGMHHLWKQEFIHDIGRFHIDAPIKGLDVQDET